MKSTTRNALFLICLASLFVSGCGDFFNKYFNYSRDGDFGTNGSVELQFGSGIFEPRTVAIQGDGKIIVVGNYYDAGGDLTAIARFTGNGVLDTGFGISGMGYLTIPIDIKEADSSHNEACPIVLQDDGKIVIAGYRQSFNDSVMIRYSADGSLDTSFGTEGIALGLDPVPVSIALQADGKIVVFSDLTGAMTYDPFSLMRYNENGTLDTGFGTGGRVSPVFGGCDNQIVQIQPDQKIITITNFYFGFYALDECQTITRYNNDGTLDTGYGIDGTSINGAWDDERSRYLGDWHYAAMQSDGRIVFATGIECYAHTHNHQTGLGIECFDISGFRDFSFGIGGKHTQFYSDISPKKGVSIIDPDTDNDDKPYSVATQTDGYIVFAGLSDRFGLFIMRLGPDGRIDTDFGLDGKIYPHLTGYDYGELQDDFIAVQPDGKVLVLASSEGIPVLARFMP